MEQEFEVKKNYNDSNQKKVKQWFIPLTENSIRDILSEDMVLAETCAIHQIGPNLFYLSVKNLNEITQIPIKCNPKNAYFYIGDDESIKFSNLKEVIINILMSRIEVAYNENNLLTVSNCLEFVIPSNFWFLAGMNNELSLTILKKYNAAECFAVWLHGRIFKLGIKRNGVIAELDIIRTENGFKLDIMSFDDIEKLIEYYTVNQLPKIEKFGNVEAILPHPVFFTQFFASNISERMKEYSKNHSNFGINSNNLFEFEYNIMDKLSHYIQLTFYDSQKENVIFKNRYKNILACDHSRVHVIGIEGNYINANHISSEDGSKRYILSQAPISSTAVDHWLMIIQQKVNIIVILTKEEEKGVEKCYPYWPTKEEPFYIQDYKIELTNEEIMREIIHRTIQITHKTLQMNQYVYIMQYLGWPDYGVPNNTWGIIELLTACGSEKYNNQNSMILVHCSAGIGRTGVFMALELIMRKIKNQGVNALIDIKEIGLYLRKYRALSIATDQQYKFIFDVIKDYIEWKIGTSDLQFSTA